MRILFITSNRIGDAVLSTGLLGHLVDRLAGPAFTIVCGPLAASLFRAVPGLEAVIPLEKKRFSLHWLSLLIACGATRWNLVVDLRNSPVSRLVAARERAIFTPVRRPVHQVEALAATLGLTDPPPPRLWFAASDRARAAELVPPGPPVLALAPAANWAGKQWPAERFAALALSLTARGGPLPGGRVALLAAAHEREQTQPVLDAIGPARAVDLVGRTDPLLAGACLARSALFVGNDSGLMHIAAAVGVPTLGLFGPSDDARYAPWGANSAAVRTDEPFAELWAAALRAPGGVAPGLMDGLPVARVEAAARHLLAAAAWTPSGALEARS